MAPQGNTFNNHLRIIIKGLLEYFFPVNALSNQKRAMRHIIRKPRDMSFNRFTAQQTEINKFLPVFPGSDTTKKIPAEELNEIFLHAVSNSWAKQSYLQEWYFEIKTKCTKQNQLLKILLGQIQNVTIMSGNERGRRRLAYQLRKGPHWQAQGKK